MRLLKRDKHLVVLDINDGDVQVLFSNNAAIALYRKGGLYDCGYINMETCTEWSSDREAHEWLNERGVTDKIQRVENETFCRIAIGRSN